MSKQSNDDGIATANASTPLDVLRNATSDYHRQLEAAIDWMGSFQSYEAYRDLLERFALVVPPLEQAIAQQLASEPPPEFDPSARTRWLESDLATMTILIGQRAEPHSANKRHGDAPSETQASAHAARLPAQDFAYIDNAPAAIGAQYVLEGSSLGGQFLSRQLHERLQLAPSHGGAYFAAHGAATGAHWQAFRQWANLQLIDPRSTRLAAEAAKLTFTRFGKALAGLAYE